MQARLVDRVRFRLLAALAVLLAAAILLAVLGWWGMSSAQRALIGFQGEVLPNVTRALELAEQSARLAATAPHLSESPTPAALESNAEAIGTLLAEIRGRVEALPASTELAPVLRRLLDDVGRDLAGLRALTEQRQLCQAAVQTHLAALDRIGAAGPGEAAATLLREPTLAGVWTSLVVGAGSDSPATLGRLEADVESLWLAADALPESVADPGFVAALRRMSQGPDGLLALRRLELELERRAGYLVVLTRANADQLSAEVARHVAALRDEAAQQRERVQADIRSGETAMVALAIGCVLIALFATRYVRRFVGQIETITGLMTRLVQGDTAPATPATRRRDELGALARSFEVFRDTLLAKQTLVGELRSQGALLAAVHENMTDALAVFDAGGGLLLWNRCLADLLRPHGIEPTAGLALPTLLAGLPAGTTWTAPGRTEPRPLTAVAGVAASAPLAGPSRAASPALPAMEMPAASAASAASAAASAAAAAALTAAEPGPGADGRPPAQATGAVEQAAASIDLRLADAARHGSIELHLPGGIVYDLRSRPMPDGGTVTLVSDLTERRRIQAEAQQAERLEVLGQLTGGVAHDFNNQLGTILGNLGLLADGTPLAPDAQRQLQRARRAAASAAALTRRLLAFARRQPLALERVEVDAMLEEMQDLIGYSAGEHTRVELLPGAPGAVVCVDRGQLENALLNLVLNSAAAMPGGGVLRITSAWQGGEGEADGGDQGARQGAGQGEAIDAGQGARHVERKRAGQRARVVEIAVQDSGVGIPEPLRRRVFEPFFTTRAQGEGSGLGLAGVYGFVKQSGGDLELTSEVGVGTRIALKFPVQGTASPDEAASRGAPPAGPSADAAAPDASRVEESASARANASADAAAAALRGRRVLVVDDDEAFRATLLEMLATAGAAVTPATDAADALDHHAAGGPFDFVLSDVCLGPAQDGVALARELHRRAPALPICLMSGLPFDGVQTRLEGGPVPGMLNKPFGLTELAAWWQGRENK